MSEDLPKTQSDLLEAMKAGVKCHYVLFMGMFSPFDYYFRSDTMKRCTAPAKALLARGLVEKTLEDRGHKLVEAKFSYFKDGQE